MTEAGLLNRERCPSDRRGAFAVITSAGESELHRALPTYTAAIERYFAGAIGNADLASLRETMQTIVSRSGGEESIAPEPETTPTARGSEQAG